MSAHSAVHAGPVARAGRVSGTRPTRTQTRRAMKVSIGTLAAPALGLVALSAAAVLTHTNVPGLGSLPGVKGLQGSTSSAQAPAEPGAQPTVRQGRRATASRNPQKAAAAHRAARRGPRSTAHDP